MSTTNYIPGTTNCQHSRVKKSNIPGVTKKDMAKWQILKWSEEDIVKFWNIFRNFEALWNTCDENYEEKC